MEILFLSFGGSYLQISYSRIATQAPPMIFIAHQKIRIRDSNIRKSHWPYFQVGSLSWNGQTFLLSISGYWYVEYMWEIHFKRFYLVHCKSGNKLHLQADIHFHKIWFCICEEKELSICHKPASQPRTARIAFRALLRNVKYRIGPPKGFEEEKYPSLSVFPFSSWAHLL